MSELPRPELLAAWRRRGRWDYINDEGHNKGPHRHDEAVERVNDCADEGGVADMLPPPPITRKASQYMRRLSRRAASERVAEAGQ